MDTMEPQSPTTFTLQDILLDGVSNAIWQLDASALFFSCTLSTLTRADLFISVRSLCTAFRAVRYEEFCSRLSREISVKAWATTRLHRSSRKRDLNINLIMGELFQNTYSGCGQFKSWTDVQIWYDIQKFSQQARKTLRALIYSGNTFNGGLERPQQCVATTGFCVECPTVSESLSILQIPFKRLDWLVWYFFYPAIECSHNQMHRELSRESDQEFQNYCWGIQKSVRLFSLITRHLDMLEDTSSHLGPANSIEVCTNAKHLLLQLKHNEEYLRRDTSKAPGQPVDPPKKLRDGMGQAMTIIQEMEKNRKVSYQRALMELHQKAQSSHSVAKVDLKKGAPIIPVNLNYHLRNRSLDTQTDVLASHIQSMENKLGEVEKGWDVIVSQNIALKKENQEKRRQLDVLNRSLISLLMEKSVLEAGFQRLRELKPEVIENTIIDYSQIQKRVNQGYSSVIEKLVKHSADAIFVGANSPAPNSNGRLRSLKVLNMIILPKSKEALEKINQHYANLKASNTSQASETDKLIQLMMCKGKKIEELEKKLAQLESKQGDGTIESQHCGVAAKPNSTSGDKQSQTDLSIPVKSNLQVDSAESLIGYTDDLQRSASLTAKQLFSVDATIGYQDHEGNLRSLQRNNKGGQGKGKTNQRQRTDGETRTRTRNLLKKGKLRVHVAPMPVDTVHQDTQTEDLIGENGALCKQGIQSQYSPNQQWQGQLSPYDVKGRYWKSVSESKQNYQLVTSQHVQVSNKIRRVFQPSEKFLSQQPLGSLDKSQTTLDRKLAMPLLQENRKNRENLLRSDVTQLPGGEWKMKDSTHHANNQIATSQSNNELAKGEVDSASRKRFESLPVAKFSKDRDCGETKQKNMLPTIPSRRADQHQNHKNTNIQSTKLQHRIELLRESIDKNGKLESKEAMTQLKEAVRVLQGLHKTCGEECKYLLKSRKGVQPDPLNKKRLRIPRYDLVYDIPPQQ